MTRDEIIKLAREADQGFAGSECELFGGGLCSVSTIERFAALVATAEREACAKLVDLESKLLGKELQSAAAIRARGQT